MERNYSIGQIYWVNLNGTGHVQDGRHPAIIVQNNIGNKYSKTVVIVPITSKKKAKLPTHVFIKAGSCGLPLDSTAQCEGVQTICKSQIQEFIGIVPDSLMSKIAKSSLINTPFLNYLSIDDIGELKNQ